MSLNPEDLLRDARFCPMLVHEVNLSDLSEKDFFSVKRACLEKGGRTLARRVAQIAAVNGFSTPPPPTGIGSPSLKRVRNVSSNSLTSMTTGSSVDALDDETRVAVEGLTTLKTGAPRT